MHEESKRFWKIAIIGSGPSGFHAAEALQQLRDDVEVTMIERLPVPFGLVRSGVAPDHPKLKRVATVYDRIARSAGFSFFGNVNFGEDLTLCELLDTHHAIILACGAEVDRRLNIPGETLDGCYSAKDFVGWYNGHPDCSENKFDFGHPIAAIVGQGNVALDVARILLTPIDILRRTDITEHALDTLSRSEIEEVHIFGRRGPAQAKFTAKELREFDYISDCVALADPKELMLGSACQVEVTNKMDRNPSHNVSILRNFSESIRSRKKHACYFHFFRKPTQLIGESYLQAIRFSKTALAGPPFQQVAYDTGDVDEVSCGAMFRAIGYRAKPLANLSFDDSRGVLCHNDGRLVGGNGSPIYGLYAVGWVKRGGEGTIGTNRADSFATVETLLSDLTRLPCCRKPGADGLITRLQKKNINYVTYEQWLRISAAEVERGRLCGKPREKFVHVEEMMNVIESITNHETL